MDSDRYRRVMGVVDAALDCEPARRGEVVASACAGDASLRAEVERLLAENTAAGTFLGESPFEVLPTLQEEAAVVGKRIGPYRVTEEIGRGGMGAVYKAVRDDDQYRNVVAVKLIKRGMDSEVILRRFRMERQILANLNHPHIARLLDGGTTDEGSPYFVMEYIEGEPLNRYCDARKLPTTDRLRLFRSVCAALQYAHQNLVVHRDLKPSNILVTADGTAKLLDFGIAKLLHAGDDGAAAAATATELRAMTPEYASPEQVRGEAVTTSSDVYSLGVLLYELLTGRRPYHFKSRQASEVARVISEVEPERPSTAVSRVVETRETEGAETGGADPASLSRVREGEPERLRRRLRGDLDNIVLRALRKEPARRYSSVEQFSEDIRRHLEGLPVTARKDTFAYRAQKFVRRHRAGVAAAALVAAALVAGLAATLWQARVARAERARAERRFKDVRRLANSFMFEFYDEIDKGPLKAKELVVRKALEYLDGLSREAGNDTGLQRELATAYFRVARIQGGGLLGNINDTKGSLESHRKALAIRERLATLEPNNPEVRFELASSYDWTGELVSVLLNKPQEALGYYRKSQAILEPLVAADPRRREFRQELASTYNGLSQTLGNSTETSAEERKGAPEFNRKAIELYEALVAEAPGDLDMRRRLNTSYSRRAVRLEGEGKTAEAVEWYRKTLASQEALVAAAPGNLVFKRESSVVLSNLGSALLKLGDKQGALEHARRALARYEELAAADRNDDNARKDLAIGHRNLGQALAAGGDRAGAGDNHRKSVAMFEALVAKNPDNGFNRRQLALSYQRLGTLLSDAGDLAGAVEYGRKSADVGEKLVAADANNASLSRIMAETYLQLGRDHARLADGAARESAKQAQLREEARAWYQKSLAAWQGLKARGQLSGAVADRPAEIERELAKLGAGSGR